MDHKQSTKGILKNVAFGFTTWLLPIALGLIATPIIVRSLGDNDYGIYALVLGVIGYSFNVNIGRAITKYVAEFKVTGRESEINEVVSVTLILNLVVGGAGVITIFLGAPWLIKSVFGIPEPDVAKTINAFQLAAGIIFVMMIAQVFTSVLQGLQRFDVYAKILNLNSIGLALGNLVLALSGFGLLALLRWNIFISVVVLVLGAIAFRKLFPAYKLFGRASSEIFGRVLRFSSGVIGYQILSNGLLLFERGWITRHFGSESLTYYVVPMLVAIYLQSFISSLLLVVFPLASALDKDRKRLKKMYLMATKAVSVPIVFLGVMMISGSHLFLSLWIGPEFADKTWILLIIHAVTFSLSAMQIVSWQMTEGLGYSGFNCAIYVVCFVLCAGLIVLGSADYGLNAVAVARLVGFASMLFAIPYVEKWFFSAVQWKVWLKSIGCLAAAGLAAGLLQHYAALVIGLNWAGLLVSGATAGVGFVLVLWFTRYLSSGERNWISGILVR